MGWRDAVYGATLYGAYLALFSHPVSSVSSFPVWHIINKSSKVILISHSRHDKSTHTLSYCSSIFPYSPETIKRYLPLFWIDINIPLTDKFAVLWDVESRSFAMPLSENPHPILTQNSSYPILVSSVSKSLPHLKISLRPYKCRYTGNSLFQKKNHRKSDGMAPPAGHTLHMCFQPLLL